MFIAFRASRKNLSISCVFVTPAFVAAAFRGGRFLPVAVPTPPKPPAPPKLASPFPTPYTGCAASPSRPALALHKNLWDSCCGEGMSSTATRPDTNYLLRKLHSLSGIIPVGAFLAEHFWSNSAVLVSAAKYDEVSRDLQTIPFRPFVEWAFIFLPMLNHAGYGT